MHIVGHDDGSHETCREHDQETERDRDRDAHHRRPPAAAREKVEKDRPRVTLKRSGHANPERRAHLPCLLEVGDGERDQCEQDEVDVQMLEVALQRLRDGGDGQHDRRPTTGVTIPTNQTPTEQRDIADRPHGLRERQAESRQ